MLYKPSTFGRWTSPAKNKKMVKSKRLNMSCLYVKRLTCGIFNAFSLARRIFGMTSRRFSFDYNIQFQILHNQKLKKNKIKKLTYCCFSRAAWGHTTSWQIWGNSQIYRRRTTFCSIGWSKRSLTNRDCKKVLARKYAGCQMIRTSCFGGSVLKSGWTGTFWDVGGDVVVCSGVIRTADTGKRSGIRTSVLRL